jgi:hypothetical protein
VPVRAGTAPIRPATTDRLPFVAVADAGQAGLGPTAVDHDDFESLALFLGQAVSRRNETLLRAAGYELSQQPCVPMQWRLGRAAQEKLIFDWVLFEFHLDAPNPLPGGPAYDAYLIYSVIVFAERKTRYFMIEGRGLDGRSTVDAPQYPRGFVAETERLLAAGFGDDCRDASSLSKGEAELVLEQARESLLPFIVERVPLRPVCLSLKFVSPPMPRAGWKTTELRLLAQAHGESGPFEVAAFVVPQGERVQLLAYDPLYLQRTDVEEIRACEQAHSPAL